MQKLLPVKNDWAVQIQNDLESCEISEEIVKNMKKETFKNLVKSRIKNLSNQYLVKLRSTHSKSINLQIGNNLKMYLSCQQLTIEEKRLLFSLKTRSINVKTNFKNVFSNLQCRLCNKPDEDESEIHVMKCSQVLSEANLRSEFKDLTFSDIF